MRMCLNKFCKIMRTSSTVLPGSHLNWGTFLMHWWPKLKLLTNPELMTFQLVYMLFSLRFKMRLFMTSGPLCSPLVALCLLVSSYTQQEALNLSELAKGLRKSLALIQPTTASQCSCRPMESPGEVRTNSIVRDHYLQQKCHLHLPWPTDLCLVEIKRPRWWVSQHSTEWSTPWYL